MKKATFFVLFVGVQCLFIGLYIDKQSRLVKLSYQKQKSEQRLSVLRLKKQELIATLHTLQNHQKIKKYAQVECGMEPLVLKKIKRIISPMSSVQTNTLTHELTTPLRIS